ncbi:MAG TPA: transcription antitermination factor NusB [Clostridia bacterium]
MGRRASRELAMKLLYQLEIQKDDREEQIKAVMDENDLTAKDKEYIHDVTNGVMDNIVNIDNIIEKHSKGWKISRIPKIDLSILRLGIFEIIYRSDIPFSVSVNEAVELAKKFSSEESGSFINGVLSKIPRVKVVSTGEGDLLVNKDVSKRNEE